MKKSFLVATFVIMLSCGNNNLTEERFYKSSNLKSVKEYAEDGDWNIFTTYYDTKERVPFMKIFHKPTFDSLVFYYSNAKVFKTGKQDFKKRKFGNWYRYTRDGFLSDIREYYIVDGVSILNRDWYLNKMNDTLAYATGFNRYDQPEFAGDTLDNRNSSMTRFDFYSGDTIRVGESYNGAVICNDPLLRRYDSQIMLLISKEDEERGRNFYFDNNKKLDTFYNLNVGRTNKAHFKSNPNYVAAFAKRYKTSGKKIMRGYMLEYYDRVPTANDSSVKGERRVYFEKNIYVRN